MPTDSGYSGRTRIKGTDPRVRAVTERIGRGTRPNRDVQAQQAARGGLSVADEAAAQDDFARRLQMTADHAAQQFPDDTRARPGNRIFTHETDAKNLESIRREGILPSTGGSNFDDPRPQVYGSRANSVSDIPEGRVRVRYQVPEDSIIGRGTSGSNAVSTRGAVPPENIMSGYSKAGRVFDAGSTTLGLMSLLGTAASFIPGFSERMPRTAWLANGGPIGDVLNGLIADQYAPGGALSPYSKEEYARALQNPAFNPQTGTWSA